MIHPKTNVCKTSSSCHRHTAACPAGNAFWQDSIERIPMLAQKPVRKDALSPWLPGK